MSQGPRRNLLEEIHRRSVWQVVTVYAVGAWFALEVVQGIVEAGNLPDWLPGMALVLLIIGFPMVIATAVVQQGWSREGGDQFLRDGDGNPTRSARASRHPHTGETSSARVGLPADAVAPDTDVASPRASVANLAAGTGSLDRPSSRPTAAQRLFTWRNAIAGGVLAFALWGVVATALLVTGAGTADRGAGAANELQAIAVLPFDNLSPDAENAYFADGIHEDVLTQLSKLADLTVISRTSVLPYRDSNLTLGQIADELGVGSILEGSVRRAGDNVRITAQLIDARTDQHLWADNFDRALTTANLFAIQSEIAQRIADALAATLSPTEEELITRSPTANLAAYDFYLQARSTYQLYTDAGNDEAIRLYKEALTRDPDYADAWAGLADAYGQRVQRFGYGLDWADSAEIAARRALQLDPALPQAYKALGLALNGRGQIGAALEAELHALELDPNYSEAVNNVGVAHTLLGRLDESLRYYKRAYRLQPNTGFASSNIAYGYLFLGLTAQAEERALEILRLQPGNESAIGVLRLVDQARGNYGRALQRSRDVLARDSSISRIHMWVASDAYLAGDLPAAVVGTEEALRLSPDAEFSQGFHLPRVLLGVALIRTGQGARGREILQRVRPELVERAGARPDDNFSPFEIATIDAVLGDASSALTWMERAYDLGFRYWIGLDVDPAFDGLKGNPGWEALLERIREDVAVMRANVLRGEAGGDRP